MSDYRRRARRALILSFCGLTLVLLSPLYLMLVKGNVKEMFADFRGILKDVAACEDRMRR